jgi:hypothetical protein
VINTKYPQARDWSAKTRDEGYFVTVLKNGLSAAKKQNVDHTKHYLRTVVKLYIIK